MRSKTPSAIWLFDKLGDSQMPTRFTQRTFLSGIDRFVSWLLWTPSVFATFVSKITGIRWIILPRFATKMFRRALLAKFFLTASEIKYLSGIYTKEEELEFLTDQCLLRGYFARAALNARDLTRERRLKLTDNLIKCDQLELAQAVADHDKRGIPEETAAFIALRRGWLKDRRVEMFAERIRGNEPPPITPRIRRTEKTLH